VVTDNPDLAGRLRRIRNHGESATQKYQWDILGSNLRMTDIAACLGLSQIRRRHQILGSRRDVIHRYMDQAVLAQFALPYYHSTSHQPNGFTFTVRLQNRNRVQRKLTEAGVETRVMWYPCLDRQPLYKVLPFRSGGRLENARSFSESCLSLPLHARLRTRDVCRIAAILEAAMCESSGGKAIC